MQADAGSVSRDLDQVQIDTLCDDLKERAEVMRDEQSVLGTLVAANEQRRPFRAFQYRLLLQRTRERYAHIATIIARFCR